MRKLCAPPCYRVERVAIALVSIAVPSAAFMQLFGAEPMPFGSAWPSGLAEIVNDKARFAGSMGPIADTLSYYAGDTDSVNAFLERLSALKDTTLKASIQRRGYAIDMKRHGGPDKTIVADWMLHIAENYDGRPDTEKFGGRPFLVEIMINPAGNVDLEKLDVPLAFAVYAEEPHKDIERKQKERQKAASDKAKAGN